MAPWARVAALEMVVRFWVFLEVEPTDLLFDWIWALRIKVKND